MRKTKIALLSAIIVGIFGHTALPQSTTQSDVANQFFGMWRLVSWTKTYDDGSTRPEPRSKSYIIYTETGHMCWVAMDPERPKWDVEPTELEELAASKARNWTFTSLISSITKNPNVFQFCYDKTCSYYRCKAFFDENGQ